MVYRRLPAAPSLEHLRNQARRLLNAFRDGAEPAAAAFAELHPGQPAASEARLTDAQLVVARSYRQPSWPRLLTAARIQRAMHDDDAEELQRIAREHPGALQEYSAALEPRSRPRPFSESRRVTRRNARSLLRAHAPDIDLDELDVIPRQHGGSVVFHWGGERMVKVPKNGHRQALLKETAIYEHLNRQPWPVSFPEVEHVHERGLYAVLRKVDGTQLCEETLEELSPSRLEAAIASIARFLSLLHQHRFPEAVLRHIPKAEDSFDVQVARTRKKVRFVAEHSSQFDPTAWTQSLDRLAAPLPQAWVVTHCDAQPGHFFAAGSDPEQLGVIDFADAALHDPGVDLAEFAVYVHSNVEDGQLARRIIDLLLANYETEDDTMAAKVELGLLMFSVRRAYQQVRGQLREADREGAQASG